MRRYLSVTKVLFAGALGLSALTASLPALELLAAGALSHRAVQAGELDAVVVLGSSLRGGEVTELLEERLERTAELVEDSRDAGGEPLVYLTGGFTGAPGDPSEAAAAAARVEQLGVPATLVRLEEGSLTTHENLGLTLPLVAASHPGPVRVALVTSDGHVARVGMLLEQLRTSGQLDPSMEVELVGARTPPSDVLAVARRELPLLGGQRASTVLASASSEAERLGLLQR